MFAEDKIRIEIEYNTNRLADIDSDIVATLNDIKVFCEKTLKDKGGPPLASRIDLIEAYSRRLESLNADYFKAKDRLSMLEYFLRD